jgi:hypothetical protein
MDLKAMSTYESKLQNKAVKTLADMKNILDHETWNHMFSELMDKISAGHYAFGSELASKTLTTINGISDLVGILCDISPDDAIDVIIKEGESFKKVFDHVIKSSVSSPDDDDTGEKKT